MPTSHSYDCVVSQPAPVPSPDNAYVLYHADLSVPENIDAVQHLIHNILPHIDVKFTIAGRNPSPKLTSALAHFNNVSLVANPDDTTMQQLIQNAHILFLFTNSPTGLKLKLLNSLYAGRHCLVNSTMVAGTELGQLCTVADTDEQQLCELDRLMHTPFTQHDIDQRSNLLGNLYSNQANAQKLISLCSDIGAPLL